MKKVIGLLVLVTLLAGLVAVAGCAKEEEAIVTPEGRVTYEDGKITIKGDEETVTWTVSEAGEKVLGVPVPENAELEKGSVAVVEGTEGAPEEKWAGATFYSPDSIDQVIEWYKSELSGKKGFTDTSTELDGQKVGLFSIRSGDIIKSVIVNPGGAGGPGQSVIVIATAEGTEVPGTEE
jgi:hypothetical protein